MPTPFLLVILTSSKTLRLQMLFKLSSSSSSQGLPLDHPSKTLSTGLLLPSAPPLTSTSTTNSPLPASPDPSPFVPNTRVSLSYPRSLMGMNTPQNLSRGEIGGGGVRYAVERWFNRANGCEITWVSEWEKDVCASKGRRGDGCRMWTIKVDEPTVACD